MGKIQAAVDNEIEKESENNNNLERILWSLIFK